MLTMSLVSAEVLPRTTQAYQTATTVQNGSLVRPHLYLTTTVLTFPISDFQVSNNALGLDFDPGTNYAGNIYVNRPDHPNDSLFFWAFEKKNGSLTADANGSSTDPWAIWLQGG